MAALKQVIKNNKGQIEDGIAWVAIWKTGRSWNAEAFWPEDGSYEDGFIFGAEDAERMAEILKEDRKAVMLNGYYTNCGTVEDETVPVADLVAGAEWNYYNGYNRLHGFYDGWVVK